MEKVKNKNGISLIVLVITILVMIILAGVVVVTMSENNPIKKAKEANFKSDIATFQEDLSMHIANKLAMDSTLKVTDIDAKGYDAIKKVVNSFTKKYENKIEVVDGKIVYVGTDKDELAWAGSAGVVSKAGLVNAPVLSSGMIPVKYNGTKWEICSSSDPSWYNYENKQWANVMLSDGKYKAATPGTVVEDADLGSMFVWIPRFAYSINKYKTAAAGAEGQTQEIHDISFLTGTTNSDVDGKVYGKNYDAKTAAVGKATPKIVHPAFTLGNKEVSGIWFAKFEASMDESSGHKNGNSPETCNFTDAKGGIKVLPSKETWRNIFIGNAFTNCQNMIASGNNYGISGVESFLMRNVDWGAVCNLATSKYGITPIHSNEYKFDSNGHYIVWSGGGIDKYKTVTKQSTTGNVTGIYDMNGGAWEYTAAYFDSKSNNFNLYATSFFANDNIKHECAKYFNVYECATEEKDKKNHDVIWNAPYNHAIYGNTFRKRITQEKFDLMSSHFGDAMYEITEKGRYSYYGKLDSDHYSWLSDKNSSGGEYGLSFYNDDFVLIGNIHIPFIIRGGDCGNGNMAGIFATNNVGGDSHFYTAFRPVIVNN